VCDGRRKPRTPLGRKLAAIRKHIVATGQRLLGWKELDDEVAERRGERVPNCKNCEVNKAVDECDYCTQCMRDIPKLRRAYIEARKAERDVQEWKDER